MDYRVKTNYLFIKNSLDNNFSTEINDDYIKINNNKTLYSRNYPEFFNYILSNKKSIKEKETIVWDTKIIVNNYYKILHYFIINLALELSIEFWLKNITSNNILRITNWNSFNKEYKYSNILIVNLLYDVKISNELLNVIKIRKTNNKKTIFLIKDNMDDNIILNKNLEYASLIDKNLIKLEILKK